MGAGGLVRCGQIELPAKPTKTNSHETCKNRSQVVFACSLGFRLHSFVCLFVCLYKTRKTILRLFFLEGSKTPGSDRTRTQALLRA